MQWDHQSSSALLMLAAAITKFQFIQTIKRKPALQRGKEIFNGPPCPLASAMLQPFISG